MVDNLVDILGKKLNVNNIKNPTLKMLIELNSELVEGSFVFFGPKGHNDWSQTSYPGQGSAEHVKHVDHPADKNYSEHREYSDYSDYNDAPEGYKY